MTLLESLAVETGLREPDLRRIMLSAPFRYKDFVIPKKGGGYRSISQPAREVKLVQRAFVNIFVGELPIHPAATAYHTGSSILENAAVHAGQGPILKMDFKDFFPSIKAKDWAQYCRITGCLTDDDEINLSSRLLFRKSPHQSQLILAIGAPSSPSLSNALLYSFDVTISENVENDHVKYTRYADDLTFSAPRLGHLRNIQKLVRYTLQNTTHPTLKLNEEKTVHATTKYSRRVTGLTLANDGRVTVGRDRKRELFVSVHHALVGKLTPAQGQALAGMLSYINSVEPDFIQVLRNRYGDEILQILKQSVAQKRR